MATIATDWKMIMALSHSRNRGLVAEKNTTNPTSTTISPYR